MIVTRSLERYVTRLPGIDIAVQHRREGGIDDPLQVLDAAKTLAQLDEPGATLNQLFADLPVDMHVGATEPVDRLLRIANQEQLAGRWIDVLPARLAGIRRSQEQEDFRLQRIGVLEFVHEQTAEAGLKVVPDGGVVANQVARVQQQIEKVERAFARLEKPMAIDALEQLFVQQRREVRVRTQLELVQRVRQQISRLEHACPRNPLGVGRSASLPSSLEVAIPPQIHELRLEAIEVGAGFRRRRAGEIRTQPPYRLGVEKQVVAGVRRRLRHVGEGVDERDDRED